MQNSSNIRFWINEMWIRVGSDPKEETPGNMKYIISKEYKGTDIYSRFILTQWLYSFNYLIF